MEPLAWLVTGSLLVGLGLLLGGYLDRSPRSSLLRAAGWVFFAAYWPFQAQHFFDIADPVNAWFCILGPVALLFFAFHEWRSWTWREDPPALRWLAGTSFVAAGVYFVFEWSPTLAKGLIYVIAVQTSWMLNGLFGLDTTYAPEPDGIDTHIFLVGADGTQDYAVTIILACTAIQSLMIFAAAIWCLRAPNARRWKAAAITLPLIHFLNLFRNAGIVYGYKILEWNPFAWGAPRPEGWKGWFWLDVRSPLTGEFAGLAQGSFEWMHSYVGKFGSLGALIVLALVLFTVLPELHANILDIFDLPKRKRPGFFDRPPKETALAATEPVGS